MDLELTALTPGPLRVPGKTDACAGSQCYHHRNGLSLGTALLGVGGSHSSLCLHSLEYSGGGGENCTGPKASGSDVGGHKNWDIHEDGVGEQGKAGRCGADSPRPKPQARPAPVLSMAVSETLQDPAPEKSS